MFRIEKVEENNKQCVIDSLQLDVIRHVFAFYDIQHEPDYKTMYAAFENGSLKGYVLVYTALEFPSVVLECDSDIAEKAGERREMYKVIILSLFESCARVNELLSRLVSLLDKELFYCFHPSK